MKNIKDQENLNQKKVLLRLYLNVPMSRFKSIVSQMLKNDVDDVSLLEWREKLKEFIPEEAKEYFIDTNSETNLNFPVKKYPEKPRSLNLQKTPLYKGKLVGIKGQYLIFEDETVFNVRSNEGLVVHLEV